MKTVTTMDMALLQVWEDIVNDFLEIACFLGRQERDFLLTQLRELQIDSKGIESCPGFAIQGRVVIVCKQLPAMRECWLYYPREKKIEKFTF